MSTLSSLGDDCLRCVCVLHLDGAAEYLESWKLSCEVVAKLSVLNKSFEESEALWESVARAFDATERPPDPNALSWRLVCMSVANLLQPDERCLKQWAVNLLPVDDPRRDWCTRNLKWTFIRPVHFNLRQWPVWTCEECDHDMHTRTYKPWSGARDNVDELMDHLCVSYLERAFKSMARTNSAMTQFCMEDGLLCVAADVNIFGVENTKAIMWLSTENVSSLYYTRSAVNELARSDLFREMLTIKVLLVDSGRVFETIERAFLWVWRTRVSDTTKQLYDVAYGGDHGESFCQTRRVKGSTVNPFCFGEVLQNVEHRSIRNYLNINWPPKYDFNGGRRCDGLCPDVIFSALCLEMERWNQKRQVGSVRSYASSFIPPADVNGLVGIVEMWRRARLAILSFGTKLTQWEVRSFLAFDVSDVWAKTITGRLWGAVDVSVTATLPREVLVDLLKKFEWEPPHSVIDMLDDGSAEMRACFQRVSTEQTLRIGDVEIKGEVGGNGGLYLTKSARNKLMRAMHASWSNLSSGYKQTVRNRCGSMWNWNEHHDRAKAHLNVQSRRLEHAKENNLFCVTYESQIRESKGACDEAMDRFMSWHPYPEPPHLDFFSPLI